MNDSHAKRLVILVVSVGAILVGSLYLAARPSRLAPVAPPAPGGNPVPQQSTTSTQPKVTWSISSLQPILAPDESSSNTLSFVSSSSLTNVTVEVVPAIAPFVTISPNTLANVSAGQPQSVQITFSIPQGTPFGTYDGTIHVRIGTSTIPQTLKVIVNVWSEVKDPTTGLGFRVPPFGVPDRLIANTSIPSKAFVNFQLQDDGQSFVSEFGLRIYANPLHLGLSDWFEQNIDVDGILAADHTFTEQELVDGADSLVFTGPMPAAYLDVGTPLDYAFRLSSDGNQIISIIQSQANSLFDRGYSQDAISNLEVQVLGTVHF